MIHIIKKTITLVLLIAICVPGNLSAQEVVRSEYYAGMPFWESPIVPFRGEYQITEAQARQRINLKLEYDSQNRIVQASVRLGGNLKSFEGFFGNLYINAPQTRVIYSEHGSRHHFYDILGNQISVQDKIYEKRYETDKYGRNVRLTYFDKDGNRTEDQFGNRSFDWKYNADGSVTELRLDKDGETVPLRGDFEFLRTRITFGSDGQVNQLQNIDDTGQLVNAKCGAATLKYFYDDFGRFLRWEVYDKEGQVARGPSSTAGEYNTFEGYELKDIIFFDEQGKPATHWSGAEKWRFTCDKFGNRTSLKYLDANDNPVNGVRGFAGMSYEWDASGRFLKTQTYINTAGHPMNHPELGYAIVEYIHDAKGLVTEIKYKDEKGEPVANRKNKVSIARYSYSDKGVLTNTTYLDDKGNIISI
ncbi:MAG: hypothetical protein AB7O48_11730 [Cyclobacteriaceae bacterium]